MHVAKQLKRGRWPGQSMIDALQASVQQQQQHSHKRAAAVAAGNDHSSSMPSMSKIPKMVGR